MKSILAATLLTTVSLSMHAANCEDKFMWLEDRESKAALDWVRAHNQVTTDALESLPEFSKFHADFKKIYGSKDKLPTLTSFGSDFLNFWTDADHVRGILRIASQKSVLAGTPQWETVLDIDALNKQEGKS